LARPFLSPSSWGLGSSGGENPMWRHGSMLYPRPLYETQGDAQDMEPVFLIPMSRFVITGLRP
jgi:hypothetical protein